MAYGVVVSTFAVHRGERSSNHGQGGEIADLCIKRAIDYFYVLNVLYCHQSVPCAVVS